MVRKKIKESYKQEIATKVSTRGRPRVYPVTETPTERVNRSVAMLLEKGGARRTFRLTPEANKALKELRLHDNKKNDTAVIEDILIKAAKAIKKRS